MFIQKSLFGWGLDKIPNRKEKALAKKKERTRKATAKSNNNNNNNFLQDYYTKGVRQDAELNQLCVKWCEELNCDLLAKVIKVFWNKRLVSTAGRANYKSNEIQLNPRLKKISQGEIIITLKHELAHLIAHDRNKGKRIKPHGYEWKQACEELGLKNEKATHDLPLHANRLHRSRPKPKYIYKCKNCEYVLYRWREITRQTACLKCCKKHNRGKFSRKFLFVFHDHY